MTMTIKLAPEMERELRLRSAALKKPASALIRDALGVYLEANPVAGHSPYALGADVFGRHKGPPDLAEKRGEHLADAWADKHARRRR